MTPQEKQLLIKDLCARLPYGVKAEVMGWDEEKHRGFTDTELVVTLDKLTEKINSF